jgi:hypothetical protein
MKEMNPQGRTILLTDLTVFAEEPCPNSFVVCLRSTDDRRVINRLKILNVRELCGPHGEEAP